MQPDGTSQKQLTTNAATNGTPAVAPDNRYMVFMSNRSGSFQVWRMDMDGANQIQLTTGVAKNFPAVSPDGKWVLYNTTDDWHVWKVSIDGGEPFMLTEYPAPYPSASPNGKMIACLGRTESRGELLILPFEGGQPLKRSGIGGGDFTDYRIQWTPDGKSLIYVVGRNGVEALVKQPLDGGPAQEIVDFGEDDSFDFGYSVDGQSLAVTRGSWHHDIVLISDLTQLLK
jgi:Tol biopolymer transport system component